MKNPRFWAGALVLLAALLMFVIVKAGQIVVLRPWPVAPGTAERLGLPEPVAASLALASLAPSSHNAQMWKIRVLSESEVLVMLDEKRLLPAVDPERREALLSMGAFLENLVRGAATQGLEAKVVLPAEEPLGVEIARVRFQPGPARAGTLEALLSRDTFRGALPQEDLPRETVEALAGTAPSRWVFFPAGSAGGSWIRDSLAEANRVQASRDAVQEELAGWLRFSPKSVSRHRDGLTPAGMGLSMPVRAFMALFFSEESATGKSFREAGIKKAHEQVDSCAGFFVLASPDGKSRSILQAGRDLEAFWLEAVRKGVAVHPMSQVLEESPWKEQIASRLGIRGTVQMVLRVGLAPSAPRPVSPRRPLEAFVERP
jgi:hypothetical protein